MYILICSISNIKPSLHCVPLNDQMRTDFLQNSGKISARGSPLVLHNKPTKPPNTKKAFVIHVEKKHYGVLEIKVQIQSFLFSICLSSEEV